MDQILYGRIFQFAVSEQCVYTVILFVHFTCQRHAHCCGNPLSQCEKIGEELLKEEA